MKKLPFNLVLISIFNALVNSAFCLLIASWLKFDVESTNLLPYFEIVLFIFILNLLTLNDYIKR